MKIRPPKPRPMRKPDGSLIMGVEARGNFGPWAPTVTQARECILKYRVTGPDFMNVLPLAEEAQRYAPSQDEVDRTSQFSIQAVEAGRFIDFGHLPNEVIKWGGKRGGPLWNQNALGQPFDDPWLLYHTWENGPCLMLVNPFEGRMELCELIPLIFDNDPMLIIADRGHMFMHDDEPEKRASAVLPGMFRFIGDEEIRKVANDGITPAESAAANLADPVMTALLMINTRNVERETIKASEKLQRARKRRNRPPIPDYDRVHSLPYVTAVTARRSGERGEDRGGTHRSPVAHIRMGHPRTYADGRSIFIRDTMVNVPEEQRAAFKSQRSHYVVKP